MNEHRQHWLVRLYPQAWRRRYGDEMDELLRAGCGWRDVLDVAKSAMTERLIYTSKIGAKTMEANTGSTAVLVRKPSAMAPILMSLFALIVVLMAIATVGTKRPPDEGAAAHIWQVLMAGQLPILAWFALHWLRHDVKAGLPIFGLQIVAFAVALLPVWLLAL